MPTNTDYLQGEIRRMLLEFLPNLEAAEHQDVLTDAVDSWLEVFARFNGDTLNGLSPEDKAGRFALFLRTLIPIPNVGMVKVSSTLRRDYGAVGISFGLEDYAPRTKAGITAGYERVLQSVMAMHNRYAAENLPKENRQPLAPASNNEPAANIEAIECDRLSVKVDDGKIMIRAHGGRFSKYGVPVYEEVLEELGYTAESIPLTGLPIKGKTMIVRMNGTKPVKVVKFE